MNIIFVSGRDGKYREMTEQFLKNSVQIPNYTLLMRAEGDNRRDSIVKMEIFNRDIKDKYYVLCAIDDRLQILEECWEKLGIYTLNINQSNHRY